MERYEFEQKWNDIKYKLLERWNRLTDEDLDEIDGDLNELLHKIQMRHGLSHDQAMREFQNWHPKTSMPNKQGQSSWQQKQEKWKQKGEEKKWGDEGKGKKRKIG